MLKPKIVVVGAGAAGLMAAGRAAEAGAEVLLLEKMKRPGLKLRITGKGRCNITNIAELTDFIGRFGKTGNFLRQSFHYFFAPELMDFLEKLGLKLTTERGGRVFPSRGKASDVLETLLRWVKLNGVNIKISSRVERLIIKDNRVVGVVVDEKKIPCDAVILTTGGASYPATGSTGDGYGIAASVGHSVVPARPALVPLETSGDITKTAAGLNLRNVKVRLLINDKKRKEVFGEMTFSEFGVTGPVILTLSGQVVDALREGHKATLSIDLKPALDEKKLDARLLRDFASRAKENFGSLLRGLLPREMVPICVESTDIPADLRIAQISAKQRRRLRIWLKDFRLKVSGYRSFKEAIITAGGVDTREVNPKTLESRFIKGLFIAGELLDIQADTGGYNLQAAFSTGRLAGRSAVEKNLADLNLPSDV